MSGVSVPLTIAVPGYRRSGRRLEDETLDALLALQPPEAESLSRVEVRGCATYSGSGVRGAAAGLLWRGGRCGALAGC